MSATPPHASTCVYEMCLRQRAISNIILV